jgi:hypothetical protein
MGHICEDRPSSAAVEELDSHFQIWANAFTNPNIAARWEENKFKGFSLRLKVRFFPFFALNALSSLRMYLKCL